LLREQYLFISLCNIELHATFEEGKRMGRAYRLVITAKEIRGHYPVFNLEDRHSSLNLLTYFQKRQMLFTFIL